MNKLQGILIGLLAVLSALSGYLITHYQAPKALGAISGGEVTKYASSTATYFAELSNGTGNRTATTTLLTSGQIQFSQAVALGIQANATNTSANLGTVFVQAQASYDDVTWYNMNLNSVNTTGANVPTISLNNASSSGYLAFTPGELGPTTALYTFVPPVVAKWMRFRAWTTGTSTVLLELFGLSQ